MATYIPELAKANPDWFGICVVTTEGHVYEVGDSRQDFTIQSISKPFVYGLALEDNTRAEVLKKISVEPTGDAFNAISLEPGTGRPRNPMINAGAIAAAGLIAGKKPATRWRRMLDMFSNYTGREMTLDEAVYQSENTTGHRNRAIGHMLRNFDILTETPEPVVDLYFRQCSISVTCRDLGVMAATLANSGVNPLTGRQAIRGEYVESILSVMGSCGMYDYAGEWLYRVGMPAKSGVGGGVIAVLPGQLGIGVFSPPLDSRGNSVRGLAVCNDISRDFDLHLFNTPSVSKSVIRLKFSAAQVNSNRIRTADEAQALRTHGDRIRIVQLQGNLALPTAEVAVHDLMNSLEAMDMAIMDFKHVISIDESASRLFYHLLRKVEAKNKLIVFTNLTRVPLLIRYMRSKFKEQTAGKFNTFDDADKALEFCEDHLLDQKIGIRSTEEIVEPVDYVLLAGLSPEELRIVRTLLERRKFKGGEVIVQPGTAAKELYFLARGRASAHIELANGTKKRLGTFSSGMVFGEMGVIENAPRSAEVTADTEVECDLLKLEDFENLGENYPRINRVIMRNLALLLSRNLRKRNQEISVFNY